MESFVVLRDPDLFHLYEFLLGFVKMAVETSKRTLLVVFSPVQAVQKKIAILDFQPNFSLDDLGLEQDLHSLKNVGLLKPLDPIFTALAKTRILRRLIERQNSLRSQTEGHPGQRQENAKSVEYYKEMARLAMVSKDYYELVFLKPEQFLLGESIEQLSVPSNPTFAR